jgi:DNA-binding response OmpR family regulator
MTAPRRGKVHTLLIVDDEPRILDSLRMNLELEGYQVFEATNGQEALDAVRLRLPDLVVMDVMMPQMDGFEACRNIRAQAETKAIPVIMVTTRGEPLNVETGYQSGCNDYVTKPVNTLELLAKVKSLIGE